MNSAGRGGARQRRICDNLLWDLGYLKKVVMTPYTIRRATAEDAETIKQMVRSAPLDPNAIDWRYFDVLEIDEDGKPKIVSIGMMRPEKDIHEIDSVVTRKEYRGKGYAAAVVQSLLDRAPRPLYLLAETALVPYYERFGFQTIPTPEAPDAMREQAEWLNDWLRGRVEYHVMGKTE
jgi:N-acetylglutamate synthase-like GNAT family acetyltransferase